MSLNYRKGDYKRSCDCCGNYSWFSEMKYVGNNRYFCRDDSPGLTELQISRHNSKVRPLIVKPRKHSAPPTQTGIYQQQEAQIFRLVLDHGLLRLSVTANGGGVLSSSSQRVGICGVYLAEIIEENERPTSWITQATAGLRAFADSILANQYGDPTGPAPSEAVDSVLYGGILNTTNFDPTTQAYGGLTLIKAYTILGDTKYLDGANKAATFLRHLQRRDAVTVSPTAIYIGGYMASLSTAKAGVASYAIEGCVGLWFLSALRAVVGGATVYGLTTPSGDFSLSTAGTLDAMMAEARHFYAGGKLSGWSNAAMSSGTFGPLSPLSATTPRSLYTDAIGFSLGVSNGQGFVSGVLFALALRGLFEYEGYSATVAAIYEWLMTFTTNPAMVPPDDTSPFALANSFYGTYDPEFAICVNLAVTDSAGESTALSFASSPLSATGVYSLAATGTLAPVRAASGRDSRTIKDTMGMAHRLRASRSDNGQVVQYPHLRGLMGLSGQMFGLMADSGVTYAVVTSAALTGSLYRYEPKTFPSLKGL